jgi:hypothetical protein
MTDIGWRKTDLGDNENGKAMSEARKFWTVIGVFLLLIFAAATRPNYHASSHSVARMEQ